MELRPRQNLAQSGSPPDPSARDSEGSFTWFRVLFPLDSGGCSAPELGSEAAGRWAGSPSPHLV